MKWERYDRGWYWLRHDNSTDVIGSVNYEGRKLGWCVYVNSDMPPGDSQHATLALAKQAAERRVRKAWSMGKR
jgi:hypothetical protein